MVKSDAFQTHLAALAKGQSLKPLYIFSGDEPLLMMEAIDALRACAKSQGFTERDVMVQDRYFGWAQLMNSGQTIDRKSTRLNSSHSQQSRMPSSA